jgi:LPS sulfotransferase NodH
MAGELARRFRNSKIRDFIRWKLDLKKIGKFTLDSLLAVCGSRDYAKFIILTRSRTGSNLLIDYLNSHRGVFARNEIFRRLDGREYPAVWRALFKKHPFFTKAVGFKIFYDHPLDAADCGIWEALEHDRTIKVIHLVRENILRSVVSQRIAEKTDFWFQKRKRLPSRVGADEKKVRLNFADLLREFEQTTQWRREGDARFKEHETLKISYEELSGDPQSTFARVCRFLGVAYRRPATSFKKQNPEPLSALIENFGELRQRFSGSRWQGYFEEE